MAKRSSLSDSNPLINLGARPGIHQPAFTLTKSSMRESLLSTKERKRNTLWFRLMVG